MREARATSPASRSGRAVLSRRSWAPRGPSRARAWDRRRCRSVPMAAASAGGTPFGFSFGLRNELFVSEAAGSASSYELDATDGLSLVSGAVLTHQGAPCWAVVTNDGRTALIGAGINDIALSHNSRYLYVLQTGGAQAIHAFRVQADGHLTALGPIAGLPTGTRGLAAF